MEMGITLEGAIKHLKHVLYDEGHVWSCESCKQEHGQLLHWLEELKQRRSYDESRNKEQGEGSDGK